MFQNRGPQPVAYNARATFQCCLGPQEAVNAEGDRTACDCV